MVACLFWYFGKNFIIDVRSCSVKCYCRKYVHEREIEREKSKVMTYELCVPPLNCLKGRKIEGQEKDGVGFKF